MRTRHTGLLALSLTLACGAAASATPPTYTLTEIPVPSPFVRLDVRAISETGVVTGQAMGNGQVHAFVWTPGSPIVDIRPAAPAIGSVGLAVNFDGQVIGDACVPPPGGNGVCGLNFFLYTPGVGTVQVNAGEPVFAGVGSFDAFLSDNGAIAGTANRYTISERALYSFPGQGWTDLTLLIPNNTTGRARVVGLSSGGLAILDTGPGTPLHMYTPDWGVLPYSDVAVDAAAVNRGGDYTGRAVMGGGQTAIIGGLCMPPVDLDPQRQFPGSRGDLISDSQMVAGTWNGGLFLSTPDGGMSDLGLSHDSARLTGLNRHGDVTVSMHSPQYEPIAVVKLFGQPARLAQDAVDPMQARIIVQHVSPINGSGEFVVSGRRPGGWQPVSMLATPGAPCPADADRNGAVNSADISAFITLWLSDLASPTLGLLRADFDGSGATTSSDISAFIGAWLTAVATGGC